MLFPAKSKLLSAARDSTGDKRFVDAPIPTVTFPSDHCIIEVEAGIGRAHAVQTAGRRPG